MTPPVYVISEEVEYATLLGLKPAVPPVNDAIDAGVTAVVVPSAMPNLVTRKGALGTTGKQWLDGNVIQKNAPLLKALEPFEFGKQTNWTRRWEDECVASADDFSKIVLASYQSCFIQVESPETINVTSTSDTLNDTIAV